MSLTNLFNISGTAASAQSQRLNVVASNLANADSVTGSTDGQAYKARQVTFAATPIDGRDRDDPQRSRRARHRRHRRPDARAASVYDPKNPLRRRQRLRHHAAT